MESESSLGHYEGSSVENDFENLSAPPLSDEFHGSFDSRPDKNAYELGSSTSSDPEPLIHLDDGIEDVPRQPEPTWLASSKDSTGPTQPSSSPKAEEKKPTSTTCAPCCSFVKNIDPRVLDLIYWRDLKKSGVVFGSVLVLLLSLALFSVLSVVAYLSLVTLTITLSFRLYKNVMSAVQKTGEGHPYKQYLEMDLSVSETKVHDVSDVAVKHFVSVLTELRRLFLVEDMVDSLKFALFLWVLTYIGAWFNGMTLIIIGLVVIFTLPKVYDTYKVQIDDHLELARTKIQAVWKQVQEKIPMPGKKKQE